MNTIFKSKLYIYIYIFEIYISQSLPVNLFHKLFSDYDIFILPGISVYILFYFSLCIFFLPFVLSDSIFSLFADMFSFFTSSFFLSLWVFSNFLFSTFVYAFFSRFLSFFNFSHFFPECVLI